MDLRYSWLICRDRGSTGARAFTAFRAATGQLVKEDVNDRRGVERQDLAEDQAANHGDAQGPAQLGTDARAQGQRQAAKKRGHCGHHNGAEAQQAGLVDGLFRGLAVFALSLEREVNHHDAVFLHDSNEQDDAYERDHAQFLMADHQRQAGADAGGGQGGKNGDGMNVALVEDAQNDVDGDQGGENQQRLVGQGGLKGSRGSLEGSLNGEGELDLLLHLLNGLGGFAQGGVGGQIEGKGDDGKLPLVVDGEWGGLLLEVREGTERHRGTVHVGNRRRIGGARRGVCRGPRWAGIGGGRAAGAGCNHRFGVGSGGRADNG